MHNVLWISIHFKKILKWKDFSKCDESWERRRSVWLFSLMSDQGWKWTLVDWQLTSCFMKSRFFFSNSRSFKQIIYKDSSSHHLLKTAFFLLLRALKSPQKFRTPSSANFLGSWHISGLNLKSYNEIWTLWSKIGHQMIQYHRFLM